MDDDDNDDVDEDTDDDDDDDVCDDNDDLNVVDDEDKLIGKFSVFIFGAPVGSTLGRQCTTGPCVANVSNDVRL